MATAGDGTHPTGSLVRWGQPQMPYGDPGMKGVMSEENNTRLHDWWFIYMRQKCHWLEIYLGRLNFHLARLETSTSNDMTNLKILQKLFLNIVWISKPGFACVLCHLCMLHSLDASWSPLPTYCIMFRDILRHFWVTCAYLAAKTLY